MSIDAVEAKHFYQDNGDKTMQNWFMYEYANILYAAIAAAPSLKAYRKKHTKENIVAFCVYFAKRLRQSIFDALIEQTPGVVLNARYIYEFYPDNSRAQTQRILEVTGKAWNEHTEVCLACPNRCLQNGFERTDAFDSLEETGWPVR